MAKGWVYEENVLGGPGWRDIVAGDLPAGAGVNSVTAADTSIVVGGTAADPTVRTATLDVIAADHPPAANWSNNGKKITSLANGTVASDAAAFGQIPTALPPNGSAGGSLTGTYPNPTIANSGVTAATYGDSSHVSQVTVGADGRVTAASSLAISGLPGSGLSVLFTTTLSGTGALDTGANAIATGHGSLYVVIMCRDANAGVRSAAYTLKVNNDGGANYDAEYSYFGGTASNGQSLAQTAWSAAGLIISAGGTANYASTVIIEFPMYDNTTFYKTGSMRMMMPDTNGTRTAILGLGYRSTSAINQLTLDTASHLLTGSTMTVYGTS